MTPHTYFWTPVQCSKFFFKTAYDIVLDIVYTILLCKKKYKLWICPVKWPIAFAIFFLYALSFQNYKTLVCESNAVFE